MDSTKVNYILAAGLASVGGRRIKGKVVREWIWWKYFLIKYKNGKLRPVETIPRMGGREIKENDRGGKFNYDTV
jgi:hypothetical protein